MRRPHEMGDSERTVRLVREVRVKVDGEHCGEGCGCLIHWGGKGRASQYRCKLTGPWMTVKAERLSPYRPIRCKACVEGDVA